MEQEEISKAHLAYLATYRNQVLFPYSAAAEPWASHIAEPSGLRMVNDSTNQLSLSLVLITMSIRCYVF